MSFKKTIITVTVFVFLLSTAAYVVYFSPVLFGENGQIPTYENKIISASDFGQNPGNLEMHYYAPENFAPDASLIVVLHGGLQSIESLAQNAGLNKLAREHSFYLVYPKQKLTNNPGGYYNWFYPPDQQRGSGETQSIVEMVGYMKSRYSISQDSIYVFGFSAGGFMTSNLLATYPDVFDGGTIIAGGPYKAADSPQESYGVMLDCPDKSPQEWGDLVRNTHTYDGEYPKISIWHGTNDSTVDISNMEEAMEQWTNVHETDQNPELVEEFRNNIHRVYSDGDSAVVETWLIKDMPHGVPIDPGDDRDEGGIVGEYALDYDVYSFYYAARFFGII